METFNDWIYGEGTPINPAGISTEMLGALELAYLAGQASKSPGAFRDGGRAQISPRTLGLIPRDEGGDLEIGLIMGRVPAITFLSSDLVYVVNWEKLADIAILEGGLENGG